jgi:hypothetical protein
LPLRRLAEPDRTQVSISDNLKRQNLLILWAGMRFLSIQR